TQLYFMLILTSNDFFLMICILFREYFAQQPAFQLHNLLKFSSFVNISLSLSHSLSITHLKSFFFFPSLKFSLSSLFFLYYYCLFCQPQAHSSLNLSVIRRRKSSDVRPSCTLCVCV